MSKNEDMEVKGVGCEADVEDELGEGAENLFISLMWEREEGDGDISAIFSALVATTNSSYVMSRPDDGPGRESISQHCDCLPAHRSQAGHNDHHTDTQYASGPLHIPVDMMDVSG